ncbi:MAG: hypothetical protein H8E34_07615 [Bacteroidetes bacterium]|nr:hypothetical protein [Bacteroidota bacterium]MBL6943534.1 hypothetical protein [Bacteroidales bacterium]
MQKTDNSPRRDFLKKIPIAIVSISAFSFLNRKKSNNHSELKFNTLSKAEADEIINNDSSSGSMQLKPAPAPVAQKNIKG